MDLKRQKKSEAASTFIAGDGGGYKAAVVLPSDSVKKDDFLALDNYDTYRSQTFFRKKRAVPQ